MSTNAYYYTFLFVHYAKFCALNTPVTNHKFVVVFNSKNQKFENKHYFIDHNLTIKFNLK